MKTLTLFFIFLFSLSSQSQTICNDKQLIANGWIKHPSSEFLQVVNQMEKEIQGQNWVKDLETSFFSGSLEKQISFKSLDNLKTPDMEMFGDVVYYADAGSQILLEMRWYQNGKKHFVLHESVRCTVDEVPYAENALF